MERGPEKIIYYWAYRKSLELYGIKFCIDMERNWSKIY
jgi:hypothetical protein